MVEFLQIKTKKFFDVVDLTELAKKFLKKISAKNGLLNIFARHTTVSIKINEFEKGFLEDLRQIIFGKIANLRRPYFHNDLHIRDPRTLCSIAADECANGHSHVAQMLLGTASETIPVQNGKMLLGQFQKILFFELDHGKNREVVFSFAEFKN